jgi:TonB family protein
MRILTILCALLVFCNPTLGQTKDKQIPRPTEFQIGVFMFFDFGPPFNYYNLYAVRPIENGTELKRFILTPPGASCLSQAKLEVSSATTHESVAELLGGKNPCAIAEKDLKKEAKRCKHWLTFSGSTVVMQVRCGDQIRLIRSDILDRDMFDPRTNTPENTAWTMRLLESLGKSLGPGVMEKPMIQMETGRSPEAQGPTEKPEGILREIDAGAFDGLFPGGNGSERFSDLYRATQRPPRAKPIVRLKSAIPTDPENVGQLTYPPLALLTRIEGEVSVTFEVNPDGSTQNAQILSGHKLLNQAVLDAISSWKFPVATESKSVQATFEFAINCPK